MKRAALGLLAAGILVASQVSAYPLDGYGRTRINRLLVYEIAQRTLVEKGKLKQGSLRAAYEVELNLSDQPEFEIPAPDPEFTAEVTELLGEDADRYGVSVLDISDPENPRYAEHNGTMIQNPGSVGKIIVLLAWFQALADLYPDDTEARRLLLRDTTIKADGFIRKDHHKVPFWKPGDRAIRNRPIEEGDDGNLWTYLDWMASASSNAAASMLMANLVLLKQYGTDYPPTEEEAANFFEKTSKADLQKIYLDAIIGPLNRNGINPEHLRQGSFFTREGKNRVPGTNSLATSRELMRYLVLMEQGKLVDPWSSNEIKRLLYLTDTRIRYASHPALDDSAVYFKSGSLYSCKPEPGFQCDKYLGNRLNYMNSVAIIESEEEGRSLRYMVVVLSNVLRKNSAVEHQTFAMRIHRLIESRNAAPVLEPVGAGEPGSRTTSEPERSSNQTPE
jgi:hypothetical protein